MTKVIAIANQKGGVGKTSTTVNLGAGLVRQGFDVLLVDMDSQANLTMALGFQNEFLLSMLADAAFSTGDPNFDLTAADLEDVTHGGVKSAYTYSSTDPRARQKAFVPTRTGCSNKRIDYISKIAEKVGKTADGDCIILLKAVWEKFLTSPQSKILLQEGGAYRVNVGDLLLSVGKQWYRCPKCKKITAHNVKNVRTFCKSVLFPPVCM